MKRQLNPVHETEAATVALPVPAIDPALFRHTATNDVLRLLVDNPDDHFTIREMGRLTDNAAQSVTRAVDVLEANDLVDIEHEGNRRLVGINRTRVSKPDDPVLEIPQPEFHSPVRTALDRLREGVGQLHGVLVFGSVARGQADRRSDIDLWALTDARADQHRANELAKELGQERFNGDRYEFQILVETPESARAQRDRLEEIFTDAITLVDSDTLRTIKREVMSAA